MRAASRRSVRRVSDGEHLKKKIDTNVGRYIYIRRYILLLFSGHDYRDKNSTDRPASRIGYNIIMCSIICMGEGSGACS